MAVVVSVGGPASGTRRGCLTHIHKFSVRLFDSSRTRWYRFDRERQKAAMDRISLGRVELCYFVAPPASIRKQVPATAERPLDGRSEARRVGKEGVGKWRSRWPPDH